MGGAQRRSFYIIMRELLHLLPKPSHYAGIEDGCCHKKASSVNIRIALAFPDTYEVGMSYLGQKILYAIVNAKENWWAERVMAPEKEAGAILKERNAPLSTLESDTPLRELDCVAFSITHELCYTNVLYMLDLAGIPLRTSARSQDLQKCPLVIAGGGALLSAEPLAPFVDLMVLGDGEESLPELLQLLEKAKIAQWTRGKLLHEARHIAGIYVPSFFEAQADGSVMPLLPDYVRPARRIVADLNDVPYPSKQVVPVGAVHNRLSLEIARGCTRGCRFCQAGIVYRPVRERSLEMNTSILDDCLRETGFDEISFLSLSTGDFSALKALSNHALERCVREQISLSLPSQRVGSIDDSIIEAMSDLRRTGMTLAPEAGSQRLRDVINKGISEEDLLLHAQKLLEHGWRQVKLYFMIGLPTETDDDLLAIVDLCCKVRDAAGRGNPRLQVTAALSPFVPKPFTPFQWVAQDSQEEIHRKVQLVLEGFKKQKALKMRWHEPAVSHLEGIISRAGRNFADVVEKAYTKGAIFCSWMEHFALEPWLEAMSECGFNAADMIAARDIDGPLPWGHLDAGVSTQFLKREWQRALKADYTDDCRYGVCHNCGACDRGNKKSLLARPHNNTKPYINRLIYDKRDQNAHRPNYGADGKLVCRAQKKAPPQINPAIVKKVVHYRVWHTKNGGGAFLSQLELQAIIERALRRADMPIAFSQGFHPMPLLSFGRALPVGVESMMEWFTITLHTYLPKEQIHQRLAPLLPQGMDIIKTEAVAKDRRTIQAERETFALSFAQKENCELARQCFAAFFAKTTMPFTHLTKKGERTFDLRPLLHSWTSVSGSETRDSGHVAHKALSFDLDWRTKYLSPLLFCKTVLDTPALQNSLWHLKKLSQIMPL